MKILIIFSFFTFVFCSFGQTKGDEFMVEAFGNEKVEQMKTQNPGAYSLFKKYAETGPKLVVGYVEKYESSEVLDFVQLYSTKESVPISQFIAELESGNLNPLKYALFPVQKIQIFKIQSGKYLIIDSQDNLLNQITE